MGTNAEVEVDGRQLKLSNLDKVLYPEASFTKAQVIDYYTRIAPVLLPHLKNRPLTLKRYPNGVDGHFFYEKQCPSHRPKWVETTSVWSEANQRDVHYCVANDLPTLVWAANLADLELHTSLSVQRDIERPTMLVFDLDPGAPADIVQCAQTALWLRDVLAELELKSFVKTSGSKGMQLYAPLNTPTTYERTKPFAHAIAQLLEQRHPRHVVSNMKKALRTGKVLIDWSQNDAHKTTVCVYSLRAKAQPSVSTPLSWDEVEAVWHAKSGAEVEFVAEGVLARVARVGDLFAPVLTLKQKLPTFP